jgi:hypothetical protein
VPDRGGWTGIKLLEIAGYELDPDISKKHSPIVNLYTLLDTRQALGVKTATHSTLDCSCY